ncbi:MAG TPA: hypothetical protein PKW65_09265, partial [Bacteroidia bacterium]|nr:hypothetical protein [Bacteroidia bacterium]
SIYLELLYRMDTLAKLSLQKKLGWFTIPVSQNNVKDLIKFGVPCLHFYTMGSPENIRKIASQLF